MWLRIILQKKWFTKDFCNAVFLSFRKTDIDRKISQNIINFYDSLNLGEKLEIKEGILKKQKNTKNIWFSWGS